MTRLQVAALVAVMCCVVIAVAPALAAPQSRPYQTSYDTDAAAYSSSTPGYWQPQRTEPATYGPPQANSMGGFTTEAPLEFVPSLNDARSHFTGQLQGLPYPNFAGFPLYPFTPYHQGLWWR